ncbi:MAG: hypothetical protein QG674_45 [Patescibacteria group bacterium]|nr:hypothetical protein [Patescibacteria group bacterium]
MAFCILSSKYSSSQSWQLPTFAPKELSSVLQGLTSLFGMGRGVTPATNHQDNELETLVIEFVKFIKL